jgi:DNA-dependent RNA polymerase auxiliary subunit epsilon
MILKGPHWCALSFFGGCVEWIFVDESHTKSPVRANSNSLLNDLLSNTAYRTMSSVKSYIDSEVLASESYYIIYIIVIKIRCETFYYV